MRILCTNDDGLNSRGLELLTELCTTLGQACASSAMIFAAINAL